MKLRVAAIIVALLTVSACSGKSWPPTVPNGPAAPTTNQNSAFQLAPSSIDITPNSPDTFNGQGDVAGVSYTPQASSACATATGGIAVSGNGVAQLDVAGSPLIFVAYATGTTPPAACTITVTGSDGSSASVVVDFSAPVVTDVPDAVRRNVLTVGTTPSSLTFTSLTSVQTLALTGFSGTTTASITCKSKDSGVQVTPKSISGDGTFTVAPFGQGTLATSCEITIADSKHHTTVGAAVTIGALAKLTVSPSSAQFGCVGTSAPLTCQTSTKVQVSEAGTQTIKIVTRPTLANSCANLFNGPLMMTTDGSTFSNSITGSSAPVAFAGLLVSRPLGCSQVVLTDSNTPAQRVKVAITPTLGTPPASLVAATPPPCTGNDPRVNVPGAPHGLYVWNPYEVEGGIYESYMESDVIGKDPNLCGVSLLVSWASVEKNKGTFDWSKIATQATPYENAGLTVNLLFSDASETGSNTSTPTWVTDSTSDGGDGVAIVTCTGQPTYPNYMDPKFEADWEDFISHAVTKFSGDPSIGYMRFAIGFGVEAIPGHLDDWPTGQCSQAWRNVGYSYTNWETHSTNIVDYLGQQNTGKQLMVALNYIPGWTNTIYDYPNDVASAAAPRGVAYGTENLGIGHVADPTSTPTACDIGAKNASIYWCQAFSRHLGKVPYEFQPIEAVTQPVSTYNIDFANLLQYALDNNTQIFEIYPQDWLEADSPEFPLYTAANNAEFKRAFTSTALIVGAHPSPTP